MINYTERLDRAAQRTAQAHEQQGQYRKGTNTPYFVHPMGVMILASMETDDEDTLIGALHHDVFEDVDPSIYSVAEAEMEFGSNVVRIALDVTKDPTIEDWHEQASDYIHVIGTTACEEAVVVASADKLYNLRSILVDHRRVGDDIWQIFSTKNPHDQLWYYGEVLTALQNRQPDSQLVRQLAASFDQLKGIVPS